MFDLLITNGTIVDGSGAAPFVGDVAIRDGRIVGVGAPGSQGADAREVIDARLERPDGPQAQVL